MSKWLQLNKTALGEQIHLHFDEKWNFSFHLIICTSFGRAVVTGRVSQKTFCLQVGLTSVCSLDCTSSDMFSLPCLSRHKFRTGYSSGATFPQGTQWGLPPPELYTNLWAWSWSPSRARLPVGPPGLAPQPPCPWAQQALGLGGGGNPHRSESIRAVTAPV